METTFIYALCEPHSRTVRYIGKANDPKRRFREHLKKSVRTDTYLGRWLGGLISMGEKPSLVVLREIPISQWEIAEERYIRLARGLGISLVNTAEGGKGGNMTPEVREKVSRTMKGTPKTPSHRAAIAAGKQGNKNPCFGKIYTQEEREKRSVQFKGEKNPNFGKRMSAEQRTKISVSLTGKTRSKESREKQSRSIQAFWAKRKSALA